MTPSSETVERRLLAVRFFQLPMTQRNDIVFRFGLDDPSDNDPKLPDITRGIRQMERAFKRANLTEFARVLDEMETR